MAQPRRSAVSGPTLLDRIAPLMRGSVIVDRAREKQTVQEQVEQPDETIAEAGLGTPESAGLAAAIHRIHRARGDQW